MLPGLVTALSVCLGASALCWLVSVLTREYSWVDRVWSILPPVYAFIFAAASGWAPRSVVMLVLATAWGARLTFNFWRKGGYAPGGEDYRWVELRRRLRPWQYQVFNLLFIAGYQNVLLLLFTLPAAVVAGRSDTPLGWLDAVATVLFLGALAGETVADQQQWAFHQEKQRRMAAGLPVEAPFLATGLFRYSRHPNFFFEQAQWWIYLLFPVAAGAGVLHLGALGAPLLTLLFLGSSRFTEAITLSKYPSYADYQRGTSMLVPWFGRAST
jgi:steroid 5-alpha reductase family enzyme